MVAIGEAGGRMGKTDEGHKETQTSNYEIRKPVTGMKTTKQGT